MEQNINLGIKLVLVLLEIFLYFILLGTVLPKILKPKCSLKESVDRGLKKYTYPGGRGILYEPHPSVRKYVNSYVLFTTEGYKYFKCKPDREVHRIKYTVVMFNRKNKVLDAVSVEEINPLREETAELLIHQDTSYVSLVLESVNGKEIRRESVVCCKLWRLALYSVAVAAVTFVQLAFVRDMFALYDASWFKSGAVQNVYVTDFIRASLIVGAATGVITFLYHRAKKIRWVA